MKKLFFRNYFSFWFILWLSPINYLLTCILSQYNNFDHFTFFLQLWERYPLTTTPFKLTTRFFFLKIDCCRNLFQCQWVLRGWRKVLLHRGGRSLNISQRQVVNTLYYLSNELNLIILRSQGRQILYFSLSALRFTKSNSIHIFLGHKAYLLYQLQAGATCNRISCMGLTRTLRGPCKLTWWAQGSYVIYIYLVLCLCVKL